MTQVKQVIRIEHPDDNLGIFNSGGETARIRSHSCFNTIIERHKDETRYPSYHKDYKLQNQLDFIEGCTSYIYKYRFAFHSLEVLNEAFTREELMEVIQDLGFRVYILEVSSWIESEYQVIFKPEYITSRKDISFMFV